MSNLLIAYFIVSAPIKDFISDVLLPIIALDETLISLDKRKAIKEQKKY